MKVQDVLEVVVNQIEEVQKLQNIMDTLHRAGDQGFRTDESDQEVLNGFAFNALEAVADDVRKCMDALKKGQMEVTP
jgi:hypothetical protein